MRRARGAFASLLAAVTVTAGTGGSPSGRSFDEVWHDGRAELCGYRLKVDRYGHPRTGRAVLITVTEPFSRTRHVKVEDPSRHPGRADLLDTFEALKVNLVRHFQTGIYDYHTMVSLFTDAETFAPVKVTFSSTEWCGQVYEETNFTGSETGGTNAAIFSYFEDESTSLALPTPEGGVVEDDLFILLRGLRRDFLAPGERRTVPFLPSSFFRRLAHRPFAWSTATIERGPEPQTIRVPAGSFRASVYVVRTEDGREGRFFLENAGSRRVLRWAWTAAGKAASHGSSPGGLDQGELVGSARLPYWKLHDPGDEKHLRDLGLSMTPP